VEANLLFIVAIPRPTCLSICEEFTIECAAALAQLGTPVDCSAKAPSGLPLYPVTGWQLPLAPGFVVSIVKTIAK
jgi:hypothetical protein